MDHILAPIIEEYPRFYINYVEYKNYVEEAPPISFLEFAMDYEERIKQLLLKVEGISHSKIFCI